MAFIDEITLHLKAGDGGDGVVRWRREKYVPKGGPAGGNGGKGGDVRVRASRDIGLLARYMGKPELEATGGEAGKKSSQQGKDGKDLIVDLPVGAILRNTSTGEVFELTKEGQEERVLIGGQGGLGNEEFKSSTNQRPREFTPGQKGEEADFEIELRLVVDAGFVGFPNAGKSTLLNFLTNAKSKVGSYEFTTLSPHLGNLYGYILADIPGLIEGASQGKGLGHKFLRHISRTRMILHCISLEQDDPAGCYQTIRKELEAYDPKLIQKHEMIILTKSDTRSPQELDQAIKSISSVSGSVVIPVSVLDDNDVKKLGEEIVKTLERIS